MRTTLKKGIGRGAGANGNGRAVLPPGALSPVIRYQQPPRRRGTLVLVGKFFLGIAAFVLLEIVLHLIAVMQSPKEAQAPKDEREQLIQLKATNVAFWVLVAGALACVGMLHVTRNAWQITQHVLLAVVVAALVKSGVQILYFRRGV